jgi:hypothetical protein
MLFTETLQGQIGGILQALKGSIATFLVGRELGTPLDLPWAPSPLPGSDRSYLETAYLAGKATQILGEEQTREMSLDDISAWLRENRPSLTDLDKEVLKSLRQETNTWLEGRQTDWMQRFRRQLTEAETDWRGSVTAGELADPTSAAVARNAALEAFKSRLEDASTGYIPDTGTVVQSELTRYFQLGQTTGLHPETFVWTTPRPGACRHCLRIHLKKDGSPKTFRLGEIAGNTNVGIRATEWDFVLGSTHPNCYCLLHTSENEEAVPGPNDTRAAEREAALNPPKDETLEKTFKGKPLPAHYLPLASKIY